MNKTALMESQTKEKAAEKAMKRIREEKTRRKDDKSVDHVLKALDSLGTTEEKLGAMCQKYAEMFNDHRLLQNAVKQAEKKNTLLQKEKEQLQAEHSKAILTRSRLENLCRELQRQNKAVKEECMLKMREEGEKKREVAAKFHSMLSEISSLLAQNSDKNAKLRDDNLDMSMRLKSVCDQFEKKEQHVENLAKQMQLEMQLADAKLAKAKMEMDIEKETLQKEKQQLLIELAEYKRKVCEMKASELALREQITMYSEKYEEFHKALLQSNSAIGDFKAEMERMTKHIRRLEKETATWKSRYDAAQKTLTEVTEGKIRSDEALGLAQRRLTALQGICRGLQDQCRQLREGKKDDQLCDEDYQQLEEQINDVERSTIDLNNAPCTRRVSCEKTELEEPQNDIRNENEPLVNVISVYTSEKVATVVSAAEDSPENELDNTCTSSDDVFDNSNTISNVSQENHFINVVTQKNTQNLDEKIENRLGLTSEDSFDGNSSINSFTNESAEKDNYELENNEIKDISNLVSYDNKKTTNEEDCDNLTLLENVNHENETVGVKNVCENGIDSLQNLHQKTSLELNKTVENLNVTEINVSNSSNNVIDKIMKEFSPSEKHLNDDEKVSNFVDKGNSNINVLRDDVDIVPESTELNGEIAIKNFNSDEVIIANSNHLQEAKSDILINPDDVSQSKSKKKRKLKK